MTEQDSDWAATNEQALLDEALKLAPIHGWTQRTAMLAGNALGFSVGETELLIPHGPADLAALLSRRHDDRDRRVAQTACALGGSALMNTSIGGGGELRHLTRRSRNQTGRKMEKFEPPVKCLQRPVDIERNARPEIFSAKKRHDSIG